ncbi:DUF2165 domain-containing protein [Myxococcota bacterium]|nr:DUF2165 domain-containing protein [Myxococcota bacterium]
MKTATQPVIRASKITVLSFFGAYAGLVTLGNLVDPSTNLLFVEHVLSMDTTFQSENLMERAITAPWMHRVAFAAIVITEALISILCLWGSIRLFRARAESANDFHAAKSTALVGLSLGLGLWFLGFQAVGGEWFASWQSESWNGLSAASRITTFILGALIFVSLKND